MAPKWIGPREVSVSSWKENVASEHNDFDAMVDRERARMWGLSIRYQVKCNILAELAIEELEYTLTEENDK